MKPKQSVALIIFTILAASGIGMLNEIIEFGMVIFAGAAEAVGGYYNTVLDLTFNFVGAIIGAIFSAKILDK
jgi:glycopeptide antibiotics resistance protein